jgi:hypothetical protein
MVFLISLFFLLPQINQGLPVKNIPINYIQTAEDFLLAIKKNEDTENYVKIFAHCDLNVLKNQVETDDQKFTFWINIYNAYILNILMKDASKYEDRSAFFKLKQIDIGGHLFSFAEIEHGILRKSQYEFFLGYLSKVFVDDREKDLRVSKRNYRLHFALNCGAASCPKIQIFKVNTLHEQLAENTKVYLKNTTTYEKDSSTVYVTPLFSWFRGDFGGLEGIKNILLEQGLIKDKNVKLKTSTYDWTLLLGNFVK